MRCLAGNGHRTESATQEIRTIDKNQEPGASRDETRPMRNVPHPVFWVIAAALVLNAALLVVRSDVPTLASLALAQPVASGGARGVFAFSGQLSKGTFGVYLVDVDAMTMWTYEYLPQKSCLRLAAARTWRYDRYLENHNICDLPPEIVEQMVEDQRQYRRKSSESQMP